MLAYLRKYDVCWLCLKILGLKRKAFHLSTVHSYNEKQLDHNRSEIHAVDTSDS